MSTGSYHAIVVGGGHNGLVAGAYFAKSGARTVVLEARPKVGGAVDTSAPFADHPEIKVSTYSYVMSLMPAFLIEELQLAEHGYQVTPFGPYYQAFPDGRSITIYGDDPAKTHASVSQFSVKDADTLAAYEAWIHGVTEVVGPLLHQVPPNLGSMTVGDLLEQSKAAWTMRALGTRGIADATRLFTMSLSELLDRWFESEQMKTIMMVDGLIGQWSGPDEPGTAYVLLHHAIGDVGGGDSHTVNWGFPQGGMGSVADSIRNAASSFGAEIRTDARVEHILVEGGRAVGVALDTGEELRAPVVVSCVHPKVAFLELVDRADLPEDFVFDIEHWKTRSGVVKINVAMSELPNFTANPGTDLQDHHTGSVELCLSRDYAERAFQDAHLEHRAAIGPFVDGAIPTTIDKGLAPEGRPRVLDVQPVGAARVERGTAPRGAGGLRRPRDRRLHRAGAELPRRGDRSPGDRALRHGAGARPDRRQHLPRRAHGGSAVPHASLARVLRLPHADPRSVPRLVGHACRRRGQRDPRLAGVPSRARRPTRAPPRPALTGQRSEPANSPCTK